MRQSLQLRIGQQLTMTPQLQQAIRLLQLSSLDLQAEIQEVLDSNLMLEKAEDGQEESADQGASEAAADAGGSSNRLDISMLGPPSLSLDEEQARSPLPLTPLT